MKFQLLLTVILFSSCTPKIVHYLNDEAKFKDLNTYRLVNIKIDKDNLSAAAAQFLNQIESRIHYQMENKRSYEASNINPDLILRYEFISNTNAQFTQTNNLFFQFPSNNFQIIYESVILLELLQNNKLVWQGSFDMRQSGRKEKINQRINNAIDWIFTTYPHQAGNSEIDPNLTRINKK